MDTLASMRGQRFVRLVWTLAAVVTCWAAVDAATTPFNQCDNIAGTCLRDRQIGAIMALQSTSVVLALLCLVATVMSIRARIPSRLLIGAVIAVAFSVSFLALDPITNLDNSRTGWLGR
jgi:hypothetical protein